MLDEPNAEPVQGPRAKEETPLPRMAFEDHGPIDGEPPSDMRIEIESGLVLRERMIEVAANADTALSAKASPTARSLAISNALLDKHGAVETDEDGKPRLSSLHEVVLTNEALGRLGTVEDVEFAIRDARQIAAAQADLEFRGMRLHDQVLATRTRRQL